MSSARGVTRGGKDDSVWRTALRPRWLGLLALVLALGVVFVELGLWQLNVARNTAREEQAAHVASLPTADVTTLLRPHEVMDADAVGRSVSATGTYDAAHQVLVVQRRLDGVPGRWVVTPLVVEGSGARLAVLRGFLPDGVAPPSAPGGRVTVTGRLSPPESAPDGSATLAPGEVRNVDLASLVNTWGSPLYTAVVFASDEGGAAAGPLRRVPAPDLTESGVSWRNLAYAAQWWIFAAFALYMWVRMVADDHRTEQLMAVDRAAGRDPETGDGPERDPEQDPETGDGPDDPDPDRGPGGGPDRGPDARSRDDAGPLPDPERGARPEGDGRAALPSRPGPDAHDTPLEPTRRTP